MTCGVARADTDSHPFTARREDHQASAYRHVPGSDAKSTPDAETATPSTNPIDSSAGEPTDPPAAGPSALSSSRRFSLFVDAFGRINPPGVMLFAGALYRWDYALAPQLLVRQLYTQVGASIGVNPAYAQWSAFVETVPLALIQLRVQSDLFGFFGANGALLSFPSPASRFGPSEQSALSGTEKASLAYRLMVSPVVRAKFWRIVVRNQTDIARYHMSDQSGNFFEWEYDTLLRQDDWLVDNRFAVMGELVHGPTDDEMLLLGPVYEWTHATGTDITRQRLGGAIFWVPVARWAALRRPRIFLMAGVNLVDRNRQEQPFAALGLGGDFDLFRSDPSR